MKKSHFFKSFVVSLVAIFMVSTLFGFSAQASEFDNQSYSKVYERGKIVLPLIEIKDGKEFVDYKYVENKTITEEEYRNINAFLKKLNEQGQQFTSMSFDQSSDVAVPMALPAIPLAVKIFLSGLALLIGEELASNIVSDFYTWGVKSGCQKWKNVGPVKSFCKANGYL